MKTEKQTILGELEIDVLNLLHYNDKYRLHKNPGTDWEESETFNHLTDLLDVYEEIKDDHSTWQVTVIRKNLADETFNLN